jgi:hypothetical protein
MRAPSRIPAVLGIAAILSLLGGPAFAVAQDVPPEVDVWFAESAPSVAADILVNNAVNIASRPKTSVFIVGEPVRLHNWNDEFLRGTHIDPLVFEGEWVAALYRDGIAVGTIAAVHSGDSVRFSYLDNDSSAGVALGGETSGEVVLDPRLGGLLEVDEIGGAEALSQAAAGHVAGVDTLDELQSAVQEVHDSGSRSIAVDGSAAAFSASAAVRDAVGLALLGVGALTLRRRRARSPREA